MRQINFAILVYVIALVLGIISLSGCGVEVQHTGTVRVVISVDESLIKAVCGKAVDYQQCRDDLVAQLMLDAKDVLK